MMRDSFIFILFFCSLQLGNAQSCCSGGVPVSSNLGFQTSSKGSLQIGISADLNFLKTLYSESEILDDRMRKRTTQSYIMRSSYSLSDRLAFEVFVPFVRQTRKIYTLNNDTDVEASFGLGDPVILGIYNVLNGPVTLRLGLGQQIPFGGTEETNSRGLFLVEDLQPGSGAWSTILFGSIESNFINRPSSLVYLNGIFTYNGTNEDSRGGAQTYQFGRDIQVIAGISDQFLILNQLVSPGLGLRYRNTDRDRVDDQPNSGTGGKFLFLQMSSSLALAKNGGSIQFGVELPVYTFVNETQLAPTIRINMGWVKTIGGSVIISQEDLNL